MRVLSGKTVLLTGATGFIGAHLARRLESIPGCRLALLSRREVPGASGGSAWVRGDLAQLSPRTWSEQGLDRIDVVLHFGGYIPKRQGSANVVSENYRDNLLGTRNLLESLPNTPETVVFASTVDVYALPTGDDVLSENSPVDPPTLYGAAKLFCEHLVKTYAKEHGCRFAVLRLGHIYGPGESAYAKLIPQSIKRLLANESPKVYGNGGALRDFLFVGDVVEAALRAATFASASIEPVNIVSGTSRPIREIVETLARLIGFSGEISYQLDKPNGHSLVFDNRRMVDVLGRWDFVPLKEGLLQEVAEIRSGLAANGACSAS